MNSKVLTMAGRAAVLVLSATAAAANGTDGSLTGADVDSAQADNTAVNGVDAHKATVVPTDQSNSKDALQVTANIRKAVIADRSLSTSAHNVKIVTSGNTVTLRGPVASAAEKDRINSLARQNAPGKDVLDQLTVKGA